MDYQGILLNLEFRQGFGDLRSLPTGHGIYAQVHWPTRSLRIGESQSVRKHNQAHIRWADKHRAGMHSAGEAARRGIIVELVKVWGSEGLEHYLISDDPRLIDRVLRVDCEKFLHDWARAQDQYVNINTQRGYRTVN